MPDDDAPAAPQGLGVPAGGAAPRAREVVVVGAVNVDLVVAAPRLPGAGETVVGAGVQRHGGGKGANAAVAAARAGGVVHLVGAVGADEDGAAALRELQAEGVDVAGVAVLSGEATGVALIVRAPDGENQIAVGAGANAAVTERHVRQALVGLLPGAGCVLVSTEIPGEAVRAAVEAGKAAGVPCVLNPAPVIDEVLALLGHGPVLTPNSSESAELAARLGSGTRQDAAAGDAVQEASAASARIAAATHAPVVVTLGAAGVLVREPEGGVHHVPARPTTARDTTGAGDTFNGVLARGLAAGHGLAEAVAVACVAAGLSVQHLGARGGMPSSQALEAAAHHTRTSRSAGD